MQPASPPPISRASRPPKTAPKPMLTQTCPISACNINAVASPFELGGHAGRGSAEYCTIENTIENVSYTIVLEAFSLPMDDDRLGYGLLLANHHCDVVQNRGDWAADGNEKDECVIRGESITPFRDNDLGARASEMGLPAPAWVGKDEAPSWGGAVTQEINFCEANLKQACKNETNSLAEAGHSCSWEDAPEPDVDGEINESSRCYCGDENDTPRF